MSQGLCSCLKAEAIGGAYWIWMGMIFDEGAERSGSLIGFCGVSVLKEC